MTRIVIDTETTGFYPDRGDELLQVAIVDADTKQPIFNELIKPDLMESWPDAEAVNGISPEMVFDKPHISAYRDQIQRIINASDVIIGYNTFFDLGFLSAAGIDTQPYTKIVDVMQLFAAKYGKWDEAKQRRKWVKLIEAAYHYGYNWEIRAHDALGDVYATLFVYENLKQEVEQWQQINPGKSIVI